MPELLHRSKFVNWFRRTFMGGSNTDVRPELLKDGLYTDALNMRPVDVNGNTGGLDAIKGEVVQYPAPTATTSLVPSSYIGIGTCFTNGHEVEFWASSQFNIPNAGDNPPIIRVDGVIVAKSELIPYTFNRTLQMAVVERCRSGVIYPADHQSPPLFWDVQAMLDALAAGSQTYFSAFTPDIVSVGLLAPASFPVLNKNTPLIDLGGPVGLAVGQYSYSVRYVTVNGDRTNWGPETPLINVPAQYQPNSTIPTGVYPGGRTIGGDANVAVFTPYAINLQFRVDNRFGYASVEVKRRKYINGEGINGPGEEEVVYRLGIGVGDVSIKTFIDPSNSNVLEVIPPDEADIQVLQIKEPKGVDYSDGRLKYANFKPESQAPALTFLEVTGRKMTSITKKLVRMVSGQEIPDGYDNAYNAAYYKSAMRGESYGYGVALWDGGMGKYPVVDIPGLENYQHPNRGDIKGVDGAWGADSETYSDDPIYAANVTMRDTGPGPVTPTFEATTQGNRAKTDTFTPINVAMYTGSVVGQDVCRDFDQFMQYSNSIPNGFNSIADPNTGLQTFVPNVGGYTPWKPRFNQDELDTYNVPPNTSRLWNAAGSGGTNPSADPAASGFVDQVDVFNPADSRGRIFAPTYHALGGLLYGVDNIPPSAVAMTIQRTKPAGRVIMQGLGSYVLTNLDGDSTAEKSTTELYIHFPDEAAAIVDATTINDMIANPGSYQMQVVAGRGFYTETYGYTGIQYVDEWCGQCVAANLMDMVSYARVQRDSTIVGANIGEPAPGGMAYQPIGGSPAPYDNYVAIDKWRRVGPMQGTDSSPGRTDYSPWQQAGQDGNSLFSIQSFVPVADGRSNYYKITSTSYLYSPGAGTVNNVTAFNDAEVRDFHQPFFVVNIIKVGAQVPEANITPYVNTGCNIALRTCIGLFAQGQDTFPLLNDQEYYDSVGYLPTDYRYTYVQGPNSPERRFLCVTNNTGLNIPAIVADINSIGYWVAPDGGRVYGLYSAVVNADGGWSLRFGIAGINPDINSRIIIRYDKNAPIRVWGHDATVAPSIHAVYDRIATWVDEEVDNAVKIGGLPLPYPGFGLNPRYFMPEKGTQTEEQIYINYLRSIRQWCIVWDAESRVQPAMFVNANSTPDAIQDAQQFFPAMHYICRPSKNVAYAANANNFFPAYDQDYPLEYSIFGYGGLRFLPSVNLDYAKQPDPEFFGLPKSGYVEVDEYCTGIAASNEFDPLKQDSPGLRTFLAQNMKVISDENGEIKVISTYLGPAGQNTAVWAQHGVCRVLTNKNVLTGASGEQVSTQSISNYWGEEMWLTRNIGSPDQLWRLWAKAYAIAGDSYMDTFYWPDRRGWYRMRGDTIDDISRNKQLKKLLPILRDLPSDYTPQMSAFFNTKYQEMWASISGYTKGPGDRRDPVLVVYSPQTNEWLGEYGYRFDRYLNTPDGVLGMRALSAWELDQGYFMSGAVREAWVYLPIIGEMGKFKEMVRWRVIGTKPDGMQLFDQNGVLMSDQSAAIQEAFDPGTGNLWAKLYDSFEGWWWRTMTTYDLERKLPQDVRFFVKVRYTTAGEKQIIALENQLKNIR